MDINEILEMGKELTTVNESTDIKDIVSKKDEEITNILKIQIEDIFEDGLFQDIEDSTGMFNIWVGACHFFADKFKLIDECLAKIDATSDQDEIAFYTKYINQYLEEIDIELGRLQEES